MTIHHARRHSPTPPLFSVGQTVRLKARIGVSSKTTELYHITAVLPASGKYPQYRVRNDDERHERMTSEDDLEPVGTSPISQDAADDRRTDNPGTEAQQTGASKPWAAAKFAGKG